MVFLLYNYLLLSLYNIIISNFMKKLIILISFVSVLFSCKENVVDGFTSESVKKDIISNLNGSEWVANSSSAYYEKVVFYKDVIQVTHGGTTRGVGYAVANISSPMAELPEFLVLRLKSGLAVDDLNLKNDYSSLSSVIRVDENGNGNYSYKRVK